MMNSQIARNNDYTTTHQKHTKMKLTNVPFCWLTWWENATFYLDSKHFSQHSMFVLINLKGYVVK